MRFNVRKNTPEVHLKGFDQAVKDEINRLLRDSVVELISHLEGNPGKRISNSEWRWGSKDGLAATISGHNKGRITPFDGDSKGRSPIAYIKEQLSLPSWPEAWAWAADFVGIASNYKIDPEIERKRKTQRDEERRQADAFKAIDEAKRIDAARQIAAGGIPIQGTNAEAYLTGRGIHGPFPDDVKYLRPDNALLLIARNCDGEIQATQRVYLDGVKKARVDVAKRTNGILDGAFVRLPGTANKELISAEGPETGLSLWLANGFETWITLGSIANLVGHIPVDRTLIAARDADAPGSQSDKAFINAVDRMVEAGITVCVASPPNPRQVGYDFNDLLQDYGVEAVANAVQDALLFPRSNFLPAHYPKVTGTIEDARAANANFTEEWADQTVQYWKRRTECEAALETGNTLMPPQPHVWLAIGVTGIGKSYQAREQVARIIAELPKGHAVYFLVPTHRLSQELADEFAKMKVNAIVYRGRQQPDPEIPNKKMCWISELATDLQSGGGDPARLCGVTDGEIVTLCEHYSSCGYRRQLRELATADVVIAAHNLLAHSIPKGLPNVGAVIVDEDPVGKL